MQYQVTLKRVEELMLTLPEDTPADDPRMVELTLLGNLVADYDEEHYPIGKPSLIEVIKLRMYEMGLTQVALSKLLGINSSRISEYLSGKKRTYTRTGKGYKPKTEYRPRHRARSLASQAPRSPNLIPNRLKSHEAGRNILQCHLN